MGRNPFWDDELPPKQAVHEDRYCLALHQLIEEHKPLREEIAEIRTFAKSVKPQCEEERFNELYDRVVRFEKRLTPHSQREDDILFPLLGKYMNRQSGMLAEMESEHEQADHHLDRFLDAAKGEEKRIDDLVQACSVLSHHFMKEENVLFPRAEKMLSEDEKKELAERMGVS